MIVSKFCNVALLVASRMSDEREPSATDTELVRFSRGVIVTE